MLVCQEGQLISWHALAFSSEKSTRVTKFRWEQKILETVFIPILAWKSSEEMIMIYMSRNGKHNFLRVSKSFCLKIITQSIIKLDCLSKASHHLKETELTTREWEYKDSLKWAESLQLPKAVQDHSDWSSN
jgi:hypothetical protein